MQKRNSSTYRARRMRTVCLDRNLDGFVFPLEVRLISRTPRPEDILMILHDRAFVYVENFKNNIK